MEKAEHNFKETGHKVPVWDVATRLFHWTLVTLIVLAFVTNNFADKIGFNWHKINGYAILALVFFRLMWGIWGSSTSRFINFVKPFAAIRYFLEMFSGKGKHYLGHNPAGAMMIVALLLVVAAQAISGLFTADDISMMLFAGPFASDVSESTAEWMSYFHRIGPNLIIALVCIHVLSNIAYAVLKRDGMITAMVTGCKKSGNYSDAQSARLSHQGLAFTCFVFSAAVVFGIVYLWGDAPFL
ncbi:cytochrome b/b6 domain-containing protein [Microvirga sp. W0021]|uniref:Cytochrome b/b6 domain-containing protein n=1 Tax=Hohaiivirga grylli TaxID=3133970 RepID=A0ABV0BMC4_9HYPH